MRSHAILSHLRRLLVRVVPRRFHTRRMRAWARVLELSREQREQLRRNLAGMLRPEAA